MAKGTKFQGAYEGAILQLTDLPPLPLTSLKDGAKTRTGSEGRMEIRHEVTNLEFH